jgi:hypothetical protein
VLHGLGGADNGGIENYLVRDLASKLVRLADEPVDCRALHPLRILAELLEYLIKPRDLVLGFLKMVSETLAQVAIGGFVDEFGQRFDDLVFGVIDVLSGHAAEDHPLSRCPW